MKRKNAMRAHDKESQFRMMTETSPARLVLRLGLPTTISMLVTTIYNMADTYFVSSLGTSQSGAVGIVFGLMSIIQAVGFMYGHGAGSNIGRLLGAGRTEEAGRYASMSVALGVLCGGLITLFGLTLQTPFMNLLGSTETILPYALEYSFYILLAAPVMVLSCILNNILRYEGKAAFAMIGLVSGGLLNIFGDFLTIEVLGMGVPGAGIATAVSQCISTTILLVPFLTGKTQSKLNVYMILPGVFSKLRNKKGSGITVDVSTSTQNKSHDTQSASSAGTGFMTHFSQPGYAVIGSILAIGLPSLMRQGLGSISTMILNSSANPYGDAAIAGMSIASKVVGFIFCVGLGIGQGFQPVAGFNYGAKLYSRVKAAYRFTLILGTITLGAIGFAGFFFAEPIVSLFRDDPDVIAVGVPALKFQAGVIFLMPIQVTTNMLFQCTGKSVRATLLSATRSGLYFIPAILILRLVWGLTGIECSQALADVLTSLTAVPFAIHFLRSLPADGE
ncbi:MAG: MATE family efflux transporter [Lachnospiraceae bacterium]|nr:MATE family efflux transporter [Lachnospiraceae bacterium]